MAYRHFDAMLQVTHACMHASFLDLNFNLSHSHDYAIAETPPLILELRRCMLPNAQE